MSAALADLLHLAINARDADVAEWRAAGVKDICQHLILAWDSPGFKQIIHDEATGEPLLIYGVEPDGNCWLLATKLGASRAKALHRRHCRDIHLLQERHPVLRAVASHKNAAHHRWLNWMGFLLVGSSEVTPEDGEPHLFYVFERRSPCAPR